MGPLQDRKKMQDKEMARSRIPRLVLRPYLPKQKLSPSSESPFSEEESKDFNLTSSRSARTISSNSFCSDDTGCPSSQSVSPVKTPSDAGMSPMGFCTGSEDDYRHKRVNVGTFADGNVQPARYKKEPKSGLLKTGSEADFSSSSSTGSISAPEVHITAVSGGKKTSFSRKPSYRTEPPKRVSRNTTESSLRPQAHGRIRDPCRVPFSPSVNGRVSHGRSHMCSSAKPVHSSPSSREKDLFSVLCRNPTSPINVHDAYGVSSPSSSNSGSYKGSDTTSPTLRRTMRYASCGDNHGIKPPSPEQYLTPLQQKEVSIRHLKAKLKESQSTLEERESEIEDLKSQLARMREDWIEEECHRVEAQLALKEARKEIKQLKQFIETMKNSLAEKDKGIQKYFIDINIQNRKLETLLRSMELAQDGAFRDDSGLDYMCNSPGASLTESAIYDKMSDGLLMEDQAMEEMADCDLLLNDEMVTRESLYDDVLMDTISDGESLANLNSSTLQGMVGFEKEREKFNSKWARGSHWMEQAIQTDVVPYSLDFENLILKIFKSHNDNLIGRSSSVFQGLQLKCSTNLIDLTPDDPNSAILLSPESQTNDLLPISMSNRAMKELDFDGPLTQLPSKDPTQSCVSTKQWSDHFLTDLLAVAVPVIPSVLWAFTTQRGNPDPAYNFGTMMRGCCLMALHTLRKTSSNAYI